MTIYCEVDTKKLERDTRKLASGLKKNTTAAQTAATAVATKLRSITPIGPTGRLNRSISSNQIPNGAEVHYGGTLPYAWVINARYDLVDRGTSGAEALFKRLMRDTAAKEVRQI